MPVPDLVIYLQASVDALMSRITRRGIDYERGIDRDYLEKMTDTYARYFYDYDESPLLIVNASSIDQFGMMPIMKSSLSRYGASLSVDTFLILPQLSRSRDSLRTSHES